MARAAEAEQKLIHIPQVGNPGGAGKPHLDDTAACWHALKSEPMQRRRPTIYMSTMVDDNLGTVFRSFSGLLVHFELL